MWWKRLHELGKENGLMPLDFETPHLQIAGTSSNALTEGHYPIDGDDLWSENLSAAIASWNDSADVPPSPYVPSRPAIV